jgi:tetratricopeptide (TPR) repeat protein
MESLSFWIWLIAIGLIAGIGLSAMVSAYWGRGSVAVVFAEPIAPTEGQPAPTLNSEAADYFQQGCAAYRAGQYRQAVACFNQAIQRDSQFAEAYHDRGRATANLRRVTEAITDLVKASELYLQQGETAQAEQIKQDLMQLKNQRSA